METIRFRHQKFENLAEIEWNPLPTEHGRYWFDTLVTRQQPFLSDPTECAKYFGVAETLASRHDIGFCFAYSNIGLNAVELAGVFVEPEARHNGVALTLLTEAITIFFEQLGARVFTLRFISDSARHTRLLQALRSLRSDRFPQIIFNLYFPDDPRYERIDS